MVSKIYGVFNLYLPAINNKLRNNELSFFCKLLNKNVYAKKIKKKILSESIIKVNKNWKCNL